jgi:hypothetical protein
MALHAHCQMSVGTYERVTLLIAHRKLTRYHGLGPELAKFRTRENS